MIQAILHTSSTPNGALRAPPNPTRSNANASVLAFTPIDRPRFRQVALRRGVVETRILWWQGAVVALILVSQMAGPYSGAATLAALTLWACRNTRCALQAVTISVLITFANTALVTDQPLVGLLKWVLLFVSLARILTSWKYQTGIVSRWSVCFVLFVVAAFSLALAVSENPPLSLLKLGTFIVGVAVAVLGVRDRRYSPNYWLSWFSTVYAVVLVLSAPLYFLPAGRSSNGFAFSGIFWHPNTYAVYIAPVATYVTVKLLMKNGGGWFMLALVPWAWYSIFASGCRTALLAVGLSVAATATSMVVFPGKTISFRQRRSAILKMCIVGMLGLAVLATSTSALSNAFGRFFMKGDRSGAIGSSRRQQVERLLSSIDAHFLTGVGFGLSPASVEQATQRDELTGLPIGAYTEQGFLPLAALTQLGAIGSVPLALFICALAFPIAKHGEPAVVALFWTALFINFGEMVFFSTGGLGMHMWLLIACCLEASRANSARRRPCKSLSAT